MKNEKYKIDDLFSEKLRKGTDHAGDWEKDWSVLEQRLKKEDDRKRMVLWLKTAGGIAALILLTLSLWLLRPNEPEPVSVQSAQQLRTKNPYPHPRKHTDRIKSSRPSLTAFVKPVKNDFSRRESTFQNLESRQIAVHPKENVLIQEMTKAVLVPEKISDTQIALLQEKTLVRRTSLSSPVLKKPGSSVFKGPRLSLSILYAPAVNGVNGLSEGKGGNDVGLLLNVNLTKKWSLSSGAIYAKKLYETGFNNYRPDRIIGFKYLPQAVDADCRVLDIPLNINYTLFSKRNNSIGVGTGISSYIMLKENYHFIYDGSPNSAIQGFELTNKNQHWLGVLNFQASYDHRINSKFSVGLQPYMRIPMQDIGFANVKLQSFGMGLKVNWNLNTLLPARGVKRLHEE